MRKATLPKGAPVCLPVVKHAECNHLGAVCKPVKISKLPEGHRVCEECVKIGATWVHLRTCQECGKTHCCDDSPNTHARFHYEKTGHPVIASAEPGERWLSCYVEEVEATY